MTAAVDPAACTGCGICAIICPEVFRMSGGRKESAVVHCETVPEEYESFCTDARDCCKGKAIRVG